MWTDFDWPALLGFLTLIGFMYKLHRDSLIMKAEIGALRTDVRTDIGELRTSVAKDMGELRASVATEIGALTGKVLRLEGLIEGARLGVSRRDTEVKV